MILYILTTDQNTIYWAHKASYTSLTAFVTVVNNTYGTQFNAGNVLTSDQAAEKLVNRNSNSKIYFLP